MNYRIVFTCISLVSLFLLHAQDWTHVGPLSTNLQPVDGKPNLFETGQLNLIEVNPWNSKHLVCGGRYAGFWESLDGGNSWKHIPTQHLGSNGVGALNFINKFEVVVAHQHYIIGGIKKMYTNKIGIYNSSTSTWTVLPHLDLEYFVVFDVVHLISEDTLHLFIATSQGIYRHVFGTKHWTKFTHEPVQSLKIQSSIDGINQFLAFSGTDEKSGFPTINIVKLTPQKENNFLAASKALLPVYTNDIMRMSPNNSIVSSKNLDCILDFGEIRSENDFDVFLLSDQLVTYERKSANESTNAESNQLMLFKVTFKNGEFLDIRILHHDTNLANLTGARTGLVYDAESRGVWFSGVKLHFAFDPVVSDKKFHNIRAGFRTGKGTIHDDIHELRIFSEDGERYLIASCDGGVAKSALQKIMPDDINIRQSVYFENMNNGLHVMLVNGFSGASKNPNFYVIGGFDIINTDFFRADEGRNEHTETTWENAGGLIDVFDNSLAIIDVSLYNQFYRVVKIDSLRNYDISENRSFHAPLNPGEAPIRANKDQYSSSHAEVIGFQPKNFVQDPYRPGRIFYVKHKVGLHQFDFESGLFVRKLDLAEMNPEPEWAGWSNDWRWWRSVSFSPQTPNSMHIIINGSDNEKNRVQHPMVIKYVGDDLDACFGIDHTRTGKGGAQWKLISERLFNRFNRFMGTALSKEQIRNIDLLDIATSPTNKNRIYVLMRSKDNPSPKIVVYTGKNWVNYGIGVPDDEYAMSMVLDYKSNDGIYLATDKNIYYREFGMTSWVCVTGNYPMLSAEQLEINYMDNTLRAGTFGLGIWKMPLYQNAK